MKRTILLSLCAATLLVSSCDFFRFLAGHPTSEEIETKRLEMERIQEEIRLQAELDSLEEVRQRMADSLAALETHLLDSLSQIKGTILNPSKLGGLYTTKLEAHYSIIVGAFRTRSYAERKLKQCAEAGYTATIVSFRNGLLAISVCPSDSLSETVQKLRELRGNGICPKDGWILVNE